MSYLCYEISSNVATLRFIELFNIYLFMQNIWLVVLQSLPTVDNFNGNKFLFLVTVPSND